MILTEETFLLYAAKHYDMRKAASMQEFQDDLKRFQYLKRLFKRYDDEKELKTRLILNHLIILYNCFGPKATELLFLKLDDYHKYLKPFVVFLNYMPEYVEYADKRIINSDIPMDDKIIEELRKI